jgi:hypothetical protein
VRPLYPVAGRGWNDPTYDPDFTPPPEPEVEEEMPDSEPLTPEIDRMIHHFRELSDEELMNFLYANTAEQSVQRLATLEMLYRFEFPHRRKPKKSA